MPVVHFLDVTNRDGVQTARTGLSKFGKTMINMYLSRLGVAQSEIGFPFLFHEVPYVRASVALADAGAFGALRLSGWCRAVAADVDKALPLGLRHYNLSISTSDQMIAHKFQGRLDRGAVIAEMTAAVAAARSGGALTVGVNAEDASRTDDKFLLDFTLAAREAGADRVRYCDTIGGDSPGRIRERFAALATAASLPVETHCHNDLGMAVANSVSGASPCGPATPSASRCPPASPGPAGTRSPTSRGFTPTGHSRTGTTTSCTTMACSVPSPPTGTPARAGWCSPVSTVAWPVSGTSWTAWASRSPTPRRT